MASELFYQTEHKKSIESPHLAKKSNSTTLFLPKENIHTGSLILVNQQYGYQKQHGIRLVSVYESGQEHLMEQRAAVLLLSLMEQLHGWKKIVPVSAWRSQQEQQEIWDNSLRKNGQAFTETYVALPGHSEHQTGLAIDLGLRQDAIDFIRPEFPYSGICQTFREKAADFGFVERYPRGKESVTGIGHEPWHFRYVSVPHAAIMTKLGLVLEEYIAFLRQFPYGTQPYLYRRGSLDVAVSYLAATGENTVVELDNSLPYSVSGNNVDGFILTEWRGSYAR